MYAMHDACVKIGYLCMAHIPVHIIWLRIDDSKSHAYAMPCDFGTTCILYN